VTARGIALGVIVSAVLWTLVFHGLGWLHDAIRSDCPDVCEMEN
jgi:hypothetical protein